MSLIYKDSQPKSKSPNQEENNEISHNGIQRVTKREKGQEPIKQKGTLGKKWDKDILLKLKEYCKSPCKTGFTPPDNTFNAIGNSFSNIENSLNC